jgi:hypothetical protein
MFLLADAAIASTPATVPITVAMSNRSAARTVRRGTTRTSG